jgi:hypothetical protein
MLNTKALAASASAAKVYVEDVFSTWLYTGNGSTQTITNGIDLAGKGGLVFTKSRSTGWEPIWLDTARGGDKYILSNGAASQSTLSTLITSFTSIGYSLGDQAMVNTNGNTYASWTFRKAEKFFDVVTYTGTGAQRSISHSLGSTPGFVIIKRTDTTGDWHCWHRQFITSEYIVLNSTAAKTSPGMFAVNPGSTQITVGTNANVNASGGTYVAYLFAHDAGGFGDSGNDSVVSCGSFTTDGSGNATVTLGWEPQWVLMKSSSGTGNWLLVDNMRGWSAGNDAFLYANTTGAEITGADLGECNSTGFSVKSLGTSVSIIYIAIRRGPMKTPTDATKVFKIDKSADSTRNFGIVVDTVLSHLPAGNSGNFPSISARLTGNGAKLTTFDTASESTNSNWYAWDKATGLWGETWGTSWINYAFRRAPGFFDVVAYTGTNTAGQNAVPHNLGAVPELIIYKARTGATNVAWYVYSAGIGINYYLLLNGSNAKTDFSLSNGVSPTSSNFYTKPGDSATSATGYTYIAYLFATCPGVSKCFSFTGNGTSQTINCGFTAGAKFVLIKRTDSTGNWLIADTTRGIVSGNDPLLYLNSTAAEITTLDWIDPDNSGFIVNQEATANANVNGATYIGLAIA